MTSAATTGSASILKSTFKARSSTVDRIIAKMVMKELRGRNRAMDIQTDCAGHSYGQVQEFFESTPCLLVFRAALEVRDKYKNAVIVAVSWVEMPDPAGAAAFKELVDTHGTGNVTELSDDVAFSGHHYTSRLEGTTVINVQAEPVGAAVPAAVLAEIAATAVGTD